MNKLNHPEDDRILPSPLDRMVEAAQLEMLPEDAIDRVIHRAKQLAQSPSATLPRQQEDTSRQRKSARPAFGWLTAAAALVFVTGTMLIVNHSAGKAFADVLSRVKAASSVQFKMTTRIGNHQETSGQMYLAGNRLRLEQMNGLLVQVADFDAKSALFLDTKNKVSQTLELNEKLASAFVNPIEQLRNAKSNDAKELGEEILNGRGTRIFKLSKVNLLGMSGDCEMMIWVDKESDLPSKIIVRDTDPKHEIEIRFEGFAWNEALDEKLFALAAPAGYQPGTVVITPNSKPTESPAASESGEAVALVDNVLRDRVPGQISFSRDGSAIMALMQDPESVKPQDRRENQLAAWDLTTGKMKWSERVFGASRLAASHDGNVLAIVIGREIQLRNSNTGKIEKKWATNETVSPLAFSPDGKSLAAGITEWGSNGGRGGKASGGVQIWDIERGMLAGSFKDDQPTTFVTYSTDGNSIAISSNSGPMKLQTASTGELSRVFSGHGPAAFSPDGETLACISSDSDGQVKIGKVNQYRLSDGSLMKSLTSEAGTSASYLLSVSFSADGRFLAGADWNGTVTIWDVASGERKQTLSGHQSGVLSAAFSPDGTKLATGSEDKTLRLWKVTDQPR